MKLLTVYACLQSVFLLLSDPAIQAKLTYACAGDLGRSFQQPKRPSLNLYRERSSLDEVRLQSQVSTPTTAIELPPCCSICICLVQPRPTPADEHDGYSASKYYSTFQEPGKKEHATHGSAGDLAALDQVEDPERAVRHFVTQST